MTNILVSMYNKKGISSIVIMCDGKLLEKNVTKIANDIKEETPYMQLLDTILKGMCLVRNIIQTSTDIQTRRVIFELNNVNIIKWFERSEVKEEYQDKFCEIVDTLEEMPIEYLFIYNKTPYAIQFAKEKYIKKMSVNKLDENADVSSDEDDKLVVLTQKSENVEKPILNSLDDLM